MGDDLHKFRPEYFKDMERLSRALTPSYLNVYDQMERVLEPIRRHHLEAIQPAAFSGIASSWLAEIALANQHWQDLVNQQVTASNRVFEDLKLTHTTWLDAFKPIIQDSLSQFQAAVKASLGDVTYQLAVTEQLFAELDLESLRQAATLPESVIQNLQSVIRDVTFTYENLAGSIKTLPEITHLPMYMLPGATREIFTTGYALKSIYVTEELQPQNPAEAQLVTEIEQETSGCITLLRRLDPALARPYLGARDALHSANADRARHILASLREFWNHLLRKLAPDELVMNWLPEGSTECLHQGRPTRKARILYVCRYLNHAPLSDFVIQDTRALVKLIDFFNRIHKLEPELTDQQLRALLIRTDSWLMYILKIWDGTK